MTAAKNKVAAEGRNDRQLGGRPSSSATNQLAAMAAFQFSRIFKVISRTL
jgi:hypothetical protein